MDTQQPDSWLDDLPPEAVTNDDPLAGLSAHVRNRIMSWWNDYTRTSEVAQCPVCKNPKLLEVRTRTYRGSRWRFVLCCRGLQRVGFQEHHFWQDKF